MTKRVRRVKLPLGLVFPNIINEESIPDKEPEEVKRLKKEVEELKDENVKLSNDLQGLRLNYASMRKDYEEMIRKQKEERDYTLRFKQDLAAASTKLSMRVQERDAALSVVR